MDHTMFFRHSSNGKIVILIMYVDDIILNEDDLNELNKLKSFLAQEFEIKYLTILKFFFRNGICKIQEKNIYHTKEICVRPTLINWVTWL